MCVLDFVCREKTQEIFEKISKNTCKIKISMIFSNIALPQWRKFFELSVGFWNKGNNI